MAAEPRPGSEGVIRAVVNAARGAAPAVPGATSADETTLAASWRIVATALAGGDVDGRALEGAARTMGADPHGVERFEAMVRRAWQAHVHDAEDGPGEVLGVDRAGAMLAVHAAFVRMLARRRVAVGDTYERFAGAAARVAEAHGYEAVCQSGAEALAELSGLDAAALYVPGGEYARWVLSARAGGTEQELEAPGFLRVDRGLFADVIAGERPMFLTGPDPITDLPGFGDSRARTMIAVPLRDDVGRPVGLLLALHSSVRELDVSVVDGLRRLGDVLAGALAGAADTRRSRAALATLPDLASVAVSDDPDITAQLEELAKIVTRATESDSAVLRVRDAGGNVLETRAVSSRLDDPVADVIGTRTPLAEDAAPGEVGEELLELVGLEAPPRDWSPAGRRIVSVLGARSVAAVPVASRYGRPAVLYVLRKTARGFDDADRACMRIVAAHAQHVIDRHVADVQTSRAIDAARSAIRLLGEALVAGVRTDRTLRFVPRLYHDMFDCLGCRVWRRDRNGSLALVSGAGQSNLDGPSTAADRALERPLQLILDPTGEEHTCAVSIDEYHGTRIVVELALTQERSLGQEEQFLAVDVAGRISEALWSAEQASAQERQLDRVRSLQDVVASAHEQLSESHVAATLLEHVPGLLKSDAAAAFVVSEGGELEARAVLDMPRTLVRAVEQLGGLVPGHASEERTIIMAAERMAEDERLRQLHPVVAELGIGSWGVVAIPLTAREQTVGLLVLLFRGPLPDGIFDGPNAGNMLPAFGRHVGSALLNAREFERERLTRSRVERMLEVERENSRQVRALHEVSRTFATSLSLDETMRAVVEAMAHRLDVDAVWIRIPNDRGDRMVLRAFYAAHPELSGALERMVSGDEARDDTITAQVMQSRQPVLITGGEVDADSWSGAEVLARLAPFLRRGSTIAVLPVAIPNEVLGTLTLLSIDPEHALTYDKVDVAAGVTAQAALALDNARLYQQQKNFAEVIQESLLPGRLPDVPGVELGVLYRSATAGGAEAPLIGGDFYDFLELEDGRLALAVGDVTGKGVGAAADTAMTKYIFRALAREHPSPASFLRYANDVVAEEITPGKFVTLFYAVIDPVKGTILCGNAGHPEPKLVIEQPDGREPEILSLGMEGLALGIISDQDYEQREYPFKEGSTLIVYTDGVVEARRNGRLYGQYRLERRLADEAGASAPQIAFAVYQDCAAYAEDGLGDDVAIVVAQRVHPEQMA